MSTTILIQPQYLLEHIQVEIPIDTVYIQFQVMQDDTFINHFENGITDKKPDFHYYHEYRTSLSSSP